MKKILKIALPVVFIISGLAALLVVFLRIDLKTFSPKSPFNPMVHTTQEYFTGKKVERWQPKGKIKPGAGAPENKAQAVVLLDLDSQKVIFEKDFEKQLPIASLTKLMTATITLQMSKLDYSYRVTKEATACGESVMGLTAGESCNVKELIYGLILSSGNDAAEVLARNISQNQRNKFIDWMNQKAKNLGLEKSRFYNPHGLDEENGDANVGSAEDLAALFYYLKEYFPFFMQVIQTKEYEAAGDGHQRFYLYNTSWDFSRNYPYLIGGKSGNTGQAGFCLLALAEKEDKKILLIILGEPTYNDIRQDTWALFDYGFKMLGN